MGPEFSYKCINIQNSPGAAARQTPQLAALVPSLTELISSLTFSVDENRLNIGVQVSSVERSEQRRSACLFSALCKARRGGTCPETLQGKPEDEVEPENEGKSDEEEKPEVEGKTEHEGELQNEGQPEDEGKREKQGKSEAEGKPHDRQAFSSLIFSLDSD
ncbi:hypothetical protein E2I00_002638 [Balaenoptera physalus]|uniref:Uncharacterized protein n=1 Tax=Balaenoptera physalus TaxID=9770 RepID=A0A643BX05_BALPH|nr:hypothetical protein E2I00_002638 [Balaenoptera physalus]